MSELKDTEKPLTLTFSIGDWEVIRGLLHGEWTQALLEGRPTYAATCERIVRTIEYSAGRK